MNSFSRDIAKFAAKCGARADSFVKHIVLDVGSSLIEKSPVGDPARWEGWNKGGAAKNRHHWLVKAGFVGEGYVGGHFRANWQLSEGVIPSGEVQGVDPGGEATLAKALPAVTVKPAGKVFYWGNTLPYAVPLENGHSKQAPLGMVGLTRRQFMMHVRKALIVAKGETP